MENLKSTFVASCIIGKPCILFEYMEYNRLPKDKLEWIIVLLKR